MEFPDCDIYMQEPNHRMGYVVTTLVTVVGGIALCGMALYWLKAEEPAPPPKPETTVVYRDRPVTVVKEIIKEVKTPVYIRVPEKKNEPQVLLSAGPWDGVWRPKKTILPMIQIRQVGNAAVVSGSYSPANWKGKFPYRNGRVMGNTLEFAVMDTLQRLHVRMKLTSDGDALVEAWMTPDDAVELLNNVNLPGASKNPIEHQSNLWYVNEQIRTLGKGTVSWGRFYRLSDPSTAP